jgi:2-iminobutanoate/2-iminopropanoate deaminase
MGTANVSVRSGHDTHPALLPIVREVRDRYVHTAKPPANSAVQVGAPFRPGYVVEIDALAVVSHRDSA